VEGLVSSWGLRRKNTTPSSVYKSNRDGKRIGSLKNIRVYRVACGNPGWDCRGSFKQGISEQFKQGDSLEVLLLNKCGKIGKAEEESKVRDTAPL